MEDKTIEIDASVTKAIVDEVSKSIDSRFDEMKKSLEVKGKEVSKLNTEEEAIEGEVVGKFAKESKEEFTVRQLLAAMSGNQKELGERNEYAMKTLKEAGLVEKASYLNAGTGSEGGFFVPNNELLTDVLNMLPQYSVLAGEARVINLTVGEGIDVSTLTQDVVMTEVGSEGASKATTKPVMGDTVIDVREFAGIALMTKKLVRQAVIDVYATLRDSFARAIAQTREQLLLTDSTSGIITKSGIVTTTLASTKVHVADITWAAIKGMPFKVPTQAALGGIYVFSRLLAASLDALTDSQGRDLDVLKWDPSSNLTGTTKNGYRFIVAESLGTTDAVSTVHAVFGNFQRYAIVVRQGAIDSAIFDSGTVTDGSSVVHNLIQENKLAMRVESWENVGYPLPGAFNVIKTAAS